MVVFGSIFSNSRVWGQIPGLKFGHPADIVPGAAFRAYQQHTEMLAAGGYTHQRCVESPVISAFLALFELVADSNMNDVTRYSHDALSRG